MQTDFGKGIAVCTMQGVCTMVDKELKIFDCSHDINNFDTYQASISLDYIVDFWPAGTVFISVVDPGVGTSRRACVARLKNGSYVVTPDNGTLTHLKERIGIQEIRLIDEKTNRLKNTEKCNIFHGRDLFAYCGAKLASGIITYEEVGPVYDVNEIVTHELVPYKVEGSVITGMIANADYHFGLICSNIPVEVFEKENIRYGDYVHVTIRKKGKDIPAFEGEVPFCQSFGFVKEGEPLLMVSESLHIQAALNCENMAEKYDLHAGSDWMIKIEKR